MTSRWKTLLPLGAGLLLAIPVLSVPWPPCSDLSLHAGMVALLARHDDPSFSPPGIYELALGHANQLFYFLAWPLAVGLGAELACRIVLAGIVAGTLVAAGHLARHLQRSQWAALAIAPAALGWSFYWGFVPQMLGLALWMAVLPTLDREARGGSVAGAARSTALMVLLGFAHLTSMLCGALATAVFALVRPLDRRTLLRLAPAVLALLLATAEDRWERRVATPLARVFASRVLWHPIGRKLTDLVAHLAGSHGMIAEATLALLVLIAAVLWRPKDRPAPDVQAPTALYPRLERWRFELLAGALLALYLVAPYSVNFGAFLYVRFLAPAFVLAIVRLSPPADSKGPMVIAPAAALFVAPVLAALPQLQASRQQALDLEPVLDGVEQASSVAVLHFGKYDHSLLFDPTSLGNRVLARKGGRLLASFADYPIAPVVVRPALRWDSIVLRTASKSGNFEPTSDLTRIRWVIAQVHDPALAPLVVRAFAPEAELVRQSGEWLLFRSTLQVLPIDSPDGPADPKAETLQDRVTRALRQP